MCKSEFKISITDSILGKLKTIAKNKNTTVEKAIEQILFEKLSNDDIKAKFPSVALIKDGLNLENSKNTRYTEKVNYNDTVTIPFEQLSIPNTKQPLNKEAIKRRKEIEAEMSELSLLIETATADKKEGYTMQYAQLASELNALL